MKFVFFFIILAFTYSYCPNFCNGHGTCTSAGTCICFPGFIEYDCSLRTCPYDISFVESNGFDEDKQKALMECSGQGKCNRQTGVCECYAGYEGAACHRLSCPNECSGHGVCTAVKFLNVDEKYPQNFKLDFNNNDNYKGWDADHTYACVCDGEFTGYDCSEKKCPTGLSTDDYSSNTKSSQIITLTTLSDITDIEKFTNTMIYFGYTDFNGNIWYSDAFDIVKVNKDGPYHKTSKVFGWFDVIHRLPVGVIDIKNIEILHKLNTITITITFGDQQTGKQPDFKFITFNNLEDEKNYPGGKRAMGFHGLTQFDLLVNDLGVAKTGSDVKWKPLEIVKKFPELVAGKFVVDYENVGSIPQPCAGNGICDTTTGICNCFAGYYGTACNEQAAAI